MSGFIQLVVSGLATGAIYALVAVGFALLWQTSQTINFAQGEFVMVPAFFVLVAMKVWGLGYLPSIAIGLVVSALLLGAAFKGLVVEPMLRHGVLPLVISTVALAILMKESVKDFYSSQAQQFPPIVEGTDIEFLGAVVSTQSIAIFFVALGAVALLNWFLSSTLTGRAMQATAQNRAVARILGVDVDRMILYTFLINGLLTALASFLISPIYLAKFTNGETLGLAAFVAAIVGGFNHVRGAVLGGLILGVLDNLAASYVSAQYRAAVPLIVLVVVILFRPQGLLGRVEERSV
ncbi:MAG: branched-chain amino acid ABC transporter permease [Rhodospirillales bacterium]|nr:branched-chain amino acid ABC transporter permease [Rhodospirillales bacterium]